MKEELLKEIEEFKKILDTLPTNNIKNRANKLKVIEEEKGQKEEILGQVKTRILNFKDNVSSLKPSNKIAQIDESLETCKFLNEWNKYNTAYEKMHLDYYLYLLSRYYKEDLNSVNKWLRTIFTSFKQVGIIITKEDFNYNVYAKKYIDALLNNDKDIKKVFDEVYWQLPNIIKVIELNIKSIYLQNLTKINRYYEERHAKYLETHQEEDLINLRKNLEKDKTFILNTTPYYLINNFKNKIWNIHDYEEINLNKKISKYFTDKLDSEEVTKLKQTLLEYNLIIKYTPILEDMKNRLNNKESYKSKKNNLLKEIKTQEKELIKINHQKNETKIGIFKSKKKDDKLLFKYNETLDKLISLYEELSTEAFSERISTYLSLDSTILEVFKFITSNFLYFVNERKKEDDNLSINTLNDEYLELQKKINKDNFIFINHIALLDEQNIEMIIADKYKLENINLTIEDLDKDMIENTIKDIDILDNYSNLLKANLNISDIACYLDILSMHI